MQLQITVTSETLKDFDDIDYYVKSATATIDGVAVSLGGTFETTVSEEDIKTQIRDRLTAIGYTWDSEV